MLFLAEIIMTYEDGREQVIGTGPKWEASYGNVTASSIYDGEIFDARIRQKRWWPAEQLSLPVKGLRARKNPPVRIKERLSAVMTR